MKYLIPGMLGCIMMVLSCSSPQKEQTQEAPIETTPGEALTLTIGTYTDGTSKGIYQVTFDSNLGTFGEPTMVAANENPSYQVLSNGLIYSVSELEAGMVSAYKQSGDTLALINQKSTEGKHPCYVDFHPASGLVSVANYSSGNGAVYTTDADGALGDALFTYRHAGSGPNTDRQEGPHAHCAVFTPNGQYLYVVDLGIDMVVGYPTFGENKGKGFPALSLQAGDGPRHLVFHPSKPLVFVISELSNTITSASFDPMTGSLTEIGRVSTLPDDFSGESFCADIHISKDGKFLYGSNRGANSIAIFGIEESGELKMLATESVEGNWPRNFTLSPDEKFLLVANQLSDNITVFRRDTETGMLKYSGQQLSLSKPVCLKF